MGVQVTDNTGYPNGGPGQSTWCAYKSTPVAGPAAALHVQPRPYKFQLPWNDPNGVNFTLPDSVPSGSLWHVTVACAPNNGGTVYDNGDVFW